MAYICNLRIELGEAEEFEFRVYQGCLDSKTNKPFFPSPKQNILCYGANNKQVSLHFSIFSTIEGECLLYFFYLFLGFLFVFVFYLWVFSLMMEKLLKTVIKHSTNLNYPNWQASFNNRSPDQ